jgi:phosphatidylinositol 3-kinase
MLYLLQLVQALKFERPSSLSPSSSIRHSRHSSTARLPANLEDFLIERSVANPVLGNHFHWYIAVESEDKTYGGMFIEVAKKFDRRISEVSSPLPPRLLRFCTDAEENRLSGTLILIDETSS